MSAIVPVHRFGLVEHLRGAAALAVTLFHAFGSSYETPLWPPLQSLSKMAAYGWQGVHVFFVLSGFCIAEKIDSVARNGCGPGNFLRDRFWRIYPAYWAAVLIGLVAGLASLPFNHLPLVSALPVSPLAWLGDFTLFQPWLKTPAVLLVSWTLSCEIGFYVLAALLLAVRPRIGASGALVAGSTLMVLCFIIPARNMGLPLTFWPEFWLGFLAHAILGRKLNRWAAVPLLVGVGFAGYWTPGNHEGALHVVAIVTAAGLVLLHPHDAALTRWMPSQWLGRVGLWSYSLYLIHAPILSRFVNLGRRHIHEESPWFVLLIAASVGVTLIAAYSFHRLIEAPLERWRRRPMPEPIIKPA